jgi:hypothetical protein
LLDEFEHSGLSGAKFAALVGIKYPTFASWVLRRRRHSSPDKKPRPLSDPAAPVRWLEAVVDKTLAQAAGNSSTVIVELPCGARFGIATAAQAAMAAALVRAWEKAAGAC